jgi:hypothetical protein
MNLFNIFNKRLENPEKLFKKMIKCSSKGHPNSEVIATHYYGVLEVECYCKICGPYTRNPTDKEQERFYERMNRPTTI